MSHVSYSQLDQFTRCAKQYQLARLQGAPQTPAVWLPAGSAVHAAIELVNRRHFERSTTDDARS